MRYPIKPEPKPRMTRSDKWNKRDCVLRYRAYCDEVRARKVYLPEHGARVTFILPMPKSWSAKKKTAMAGTPHQQKPDNDNLLKALCDALYADDSGIWDVRITKLWGYDGEIIIKHDEVVAA